MKPQKTYVAFTTGDLPLAEEWYGRFFGRGPDYRPMGTLVQWELSEHGGLQLTSDNTLGGHGGMSLVVADVEAERARLAAVGITLEPSFEGTYSTLAQISDPDGNRIVLETPPSPDYPAA